MGGNVPTPSITGTRRGPRSRSSSSPLGQLLAQETVTSAEHRYLMTVIATASNPSSTVAVSTSTGSAPPHTIDTLRDIHAAHPDAELFFITGADAVARRS